MINDQLDISVYEMIQECFKSAVVLGSRKILDSDASAYFSALGLSLLLVGLGLGPSGLG